MIELMVALMVIGIIISFVGPQAMKLLGKGKKTSTQNTLKQVATGIQQFNMDIGRYPNKLEDLVKRPEEAPNWDGPYAGKENTVNPEIPKDAWGQDLMYKLNPRSSIPPFELYSQGDPNKEDDRIYA